MSVYNGVLFYRAMLCIATIMLSQGVCPPVSHDTVLYLYGLTCVSSKFSHHSSFLEPKRVPKFRRDHSRRGRRLMVGMKNWLFSTN